MTIRDVRYAAGERLRVTRGATAAGTGGWPPEASAHTDTGGSGQMANDDSTIVPVVTQRNDNSRLASLSMRPC
jgi:hypothetical protein